MISQVSKAKKVIFILIGYILILLVMLDFEPKNLNIIRIAYSVLYYFILLGSMLFFLKLLDKQILSGSKFWIKILCGIAVFGFIYLLEYILKVSIQGYDNLKPLTSLIWIPIGYIIIELHKLNRKNK